jgi:BirA family biotin operon repressor/biotin-[acetyl-CoA-carboxylase] ligase
LTENQFQLRTLKTALKPFKLHFFTRLRSTNDHAARLRRERRLYAPSVIVAASQTAGRGRGSNTWWSGKGSLTVTFVLPADANTPPHHVPLLAGLAVQRALTSLVGEGLVKLKWPNDLLHDDLKLAGLLCERSDNVDFVGLGLNVNVLIDDIASSLRHRVTSLRAITGRTIPLGEVVAAVASQLASLLLQKDYGSFSAILREYNRVHALTGRMLRITEAGENRVVQGTCEGLDSEGRLILRTSSGPRRIVAGHVELS